MHLLKIWLVSAVLIAAVSAVFPGIQPAKDSPAIWSYCFNWLKMLPIHLKIIRECGLKEATCSGECDKQFDCISKVLTSDSTKPNTPDGDQPPAPPPADDQNWEVLRGKLLEMFTPNVSLWAKYMLDNEHDKNGGKSNGAFYGAVVKNLKVLCPAEMHHVKQPACDKPCQ
ncbi:hypothetical protein GQ42DRAFT_154603 [Ramicandelaber brevisporus]|nr:hypothetical protein GQ42DRAFT_154603 [Ramicandelaber brevisporus]